MNKKLSSFESISTSEINDSSVYVSAVQKLKDGSYKNINIPISQLSGLWNNDVQLAIANADFEGGAIDAEVIHQAALQAVEAALTEARQAVNAAIAAANDFAGDVATGNTATQKAIADAQQQLNQAIQDGQSVVAQMQTMYAQYFGDNGEVRQALNEANRDLNTSRALLTSAQEDLQALANGEITPESLHEIERTVNGIKEMWGIEGTYVNSEGTVANKVLEYVDMALAQKNLKMTNINGETNNVTSFEQLVDAANGMYTTTLNRMNTAEQKVTQMQEEWDVTKGEMSEYVKTSDFSDPTKASLKSAVKSMTDSLIKQTVRDTTLDVITTITIPINSPQGYTVRVPNIEKETFYYMSWDDAEGDNAIPLNYQFKVVASGSAAPSADNNVWSPLTLDGVHSPTIVTYDNEEVVPDTNDRYLFIQYNGLGPATKQIDVKVCVEKYLSQTQIQQTANAIVLSAINSLKKGGQLASSLTLTDDQISTAVRKYFNSIDFNATSIKQTADLIQQTVLSFLDEGNNNYRTLQSVIKSAKDSIEQSVEDYTLTLLEEFKNNAPNIDHKINTDYSIDNSGSSITFKNRRRIISNLEQGHTYFIKCVALSKLYYKYGTYNFENVNVDVPFLDNENNGWTKIVNPDSIKVDVPSDASWSTITFFIESAKNNSNPPQYLANNDFSVQVFETATSKAANFKITPEMIKETISGDTGADGIIHQIYQRLARPSGTSTTWGEAGGGFLNQAQVDESAEEICRTLMGMSTGDASTDPIVRSSELKQSLDEIKSDVSKVQYLALKNEGDDALSSEYFGISNKTGFNYLNDISQYQKGPEFDITPNADAFGYFKIKVPYPNTDYTLLLVDLDKYNFGEVHFVNAETLNSITENNFKQDKSHTSCVYTPDTNYPTKNKLNPLHFGSVTTGYLSFKIIRAAGNNNTLNATYFSNNPVHVKLGIPTDIAVSNIKQTADSITEQVSSLEETWGPNGEKAQSLKTALQNISSDAIESVVAEEIDGKLTGYSTIEQTKDFIASTVGAAGAVTNKFHDPLFKHDYSYWHRRYSNYPNYSNIANIVSPAANVYNKYYDNNNNYYQINSSNILEKDLKSFIIYDNNTLNINGLSAEDRRHIYGLYTNLKVISGNKYTASFYIKLPAVFSSGYTSLINVPNSNNKFRCSFQNLMLNVGFVDELAKLTPNFYITLLSTENSLEDIENTKYTIIDGEEVKNWSSETLYNTQHKKAYKFNNQGNLTGNGFNNGSVDLDQFGLWIKFGQGNLLNYLNKAFTISLGDVDNSGINIEQNVRYRWFKIWFTFTADNKHIVKNSDTSLTNIVDDRDRAFCFEPWTNIYSNKYSRIFCEFAAPMLNSGTTPLKFSSQEKSDEVYSVISQTKNAIDLSINNVRQGLEKVGITIDAEHPEKSKIKLSADVLEADLAEAKFTGNIEAKSFKVQPQGSDSSISLVIYNPNDTSFVHKYITDHNTTLKISEGTPVLVSTVGEDVYLINLTKINKNGDITYYFKIRTDMPITIKNIGYSEASGNTISEFKIKPVKYFLNNVYNIYLEKYVAESIVDTQKNTITLGNVTSNSFYNSLNCSGFTFKYSTNEGDKSLTFDGDDKPYIKSTGVLKYESINLKQVAQNIRGINYFSINSPVFSLDYSRGGDIYDMPIYRHNFSQPGNSAYDSAGNLHVTNEGSLRMFKVYKNINSSGTLINLTHFENNKRSDDKYCYAIESKDRTTGETFYQILGFYNIARYFGDLTNNNRYYNDIYDVEQGDGSKCFSIAEDIINNCFVIGCHISKNLNENTLTDNNNSYRVFFNEDECTRLNDRLSRGYAGAIGKANNSWNSKKIIVDKYN